MADSVTPDNVDVFLDNVALGGPLEKTLPRKKLMAGKGLTKCPANGFVGSLFSDVFFVIFI